MVVFCNLAQTYVISPMQGSFGRQGGYLACQNEFLSFFC